MTEIAHVAVEKLEGPPSAVSYLPQLPEPAYSELIALADSLGINDSRPGQDSLMSIRTAADNPDLQKFFGRLRALGWDVAHRFVSRAKRTNQFQYWISRTYEEADLDAAELLYLMNWRHLTDFGGRDGERWIGDVEYVGEDTGEGWMQQIGTIGQQSFFVSSMVREQMTRVGIQGVKFHSLHWDRPEEAKGEFWELDAEFQMPPCLLPVVDMDGPIAYEEDLPYSPVELKFERESVAAMGHFDLAWTRENVGDLRRQDWGRHWLVVTQKFRQFFRSINLPVKYGVVRLVK
jgi:hypothetical protein